MLICVSVLLSCDGERPLSVDLWSVPPKMKGLGISLPTWFSKVKGKAEDSRMMSLPWKVPVQTPNRGHLLCHCPSSQDSTEGLPTYQPTILPAGSLWAVWSLLSVWGSHTSLLWAMTAASPPWLSAGKKIPKDPIWICIFHVSLGRESSCGLGMEPRARGGRKTVLSPITLGPYLCLEAFFLDCKI